MITSRKKQSMASPSLIKRATFVKLLMLVITFTPYLVCSQAISTGLSNAELEIKDVVVKLNKELVGQGGPTNQPELINTCEQFGEFVIDQFKSLSNNFSGQQMVGRPDLSNYAIVKYEESVDVDGLVSQLNDLPIVEYAEPSGAMYGTGKTIDDKMKAAGMSASKMAVPNDEYYRLQYWSHNDGTFPQEGGAKESAPSYFPKCIPDADIDLQEAWDITKGSKSVKLSILDTGINTENTDVKGRIVGQRDFVNNDNNASDDNGHGSNCGGIFFATGNNNTLHAGVNWNSDVIIGKVLSANNSGSWTDLADAIIWSVDNGADVISMSIGGQDAPQVLRDAVKYAYNNNVVMIGASGNDNKNSDNYPSSYPEVISVGATTCNDYRANNNIWGSNFHNTVDLVAPGSYIYGLAPNNNEPGYWYGGTSMATPMVAGAASLMLSVDPSLSVEEVRNILRSTADDQVGRSSEDTPGYDIYHGAGRLNVRTALQAVSNFCDIGAPCDDNDVCTVGETYQEFCICGGGTFLPDDDNDGVCNNEDRCNNFDDTLAGQPCDDGDECTVGDVWDRDTCSCKSGTITDEDNDGICSALDPDDTWACVPNQGHPLCASNNCGAIFFEDFNDRSNTNELWKGVGKVHWDDYCVSGECPYLVNDSKLTSVPFDMNEYDEASLIFTVINYDPSHTGDGTFDIKGSTDGGATFSIIETFNYAYYGEYRKISSNIPNRYMVNGLLLRFEQRFYNGFRINIDDITVEGCVRAGGGCNNTPCNDYNPCTVNDLLDANCNCKGTYQDSDNDSVCDANDKCPNGDDTIDSDGDGIPMVTIVQQMMCMTSIAFVAVLFKI